MELPFTILRPLDSFSWHSSTSVEISCTKDIVETSSHLEAERPLRRRPLLDLDLELEGDLALLLRLGERERLRESRPPPRPR